jgi:hypothetical protein
MCSFLMKFFSMLRYKNMGEVGCLKDGSFQNLQVEGPSIMSNSVYARGYTAAAGGGARPSLVTKWPAHKVVSSGAYLVTIADILQGIIVTDPAAAVDFTMPTAALAVAGVAGVKVGDCIDFSIINIGTGGEDETITVVAGANSTAVGFLDIENAVTTHDAFSVGSSMWRIRFTAVTGTETYHLYRLA